MGERCQHRKPGEAYPDPVFGRLFLLSCAIVFAVACSDDGRSLQSPPSGATIAERAPDTTATTTPPPTTPTPAPMMQLISPGFASGAQLPAQYTCTGGSQRPALSWLDVPAGTVELAVVVRRIDDQEILWVATGIDPALPGLDSVPIETPAIEHVRADGESTWIGPCPDDPTVQTYEWVLYALASPAGLTEAATADEAADAADIRSTVRATISAFSP